MKKLVLNFKFTVFGVIILWALLCVFWVGPVFAKEGAKIDPKIDEKVRDIIFGGDNPSVDTNITASDDPNYDFMNATENYKIYFKRDPITNKTNIKYQRQDSWVEFDSLSSVKLAGKKDSVNSIASANDWKYCKYLFGLCDLFAYIKTFGTAAISFGGQNSNGNVLESQKSRFVYPKVWESKSKDAFIDAEYEISAQNFLEEFVLNKYQDIDSVSQNLILHNAYLKQEGDNINFYSLAGSEQADQILFFIPKPKMYEKGDNSIENYGLHFEITEIDSSRYILTKVIDQEGKDWLASSERTWPVVIDATISFGSEYVFSAAITSSVSVTTLDATHFVVAYYSYGYGRVVIGTISGSEVSYGAAYNFNSALIDSVSVTTLDATHFVVAYYDCGNAGCLYPVGTARVGAVSGTEVSFGLEYNFEEIGVDYVSISALDSTHFVVTYQNSENSYGTAKIGTVSDTVISYGSRYLFTEENVNNTSVSALDSTHFVVAYAEFSGGGGIYYGKAKIGAVSGDAISYGLEYVFNDANTESISVSIFDSAHFVVGYKDNTNYGTAIIGAVSGDAISYGLEYVFNSGSTNYISICGLSSDNFMVAYSDVDNFYYGTAIIGAVSGDAISYGLEYVFNSGSTRYWISAASFGSSNFVIAYQDYGYGYYGTTIIGVYTPNTVPVISIEPSDGGSSSSSPTNTGSNVTFTTTATDTESDNYYLAVCKTDAITANINSIPTCDSGSWCISSSTSSESEASCNYATSSGDAESNAWYAFACDYSDEPLCSSSAQGTGDSGSPFSVNHRPDFTAISDAPDPITAGSDITFTATASDLDTDGSADTVTLYVCKLNDFTGSACGAGGEWCHSLALGSNPSCSYTILEGDGTGSKNYYSYIIDSHSFASSSNPRSGTFTIGSSAPVFEQTHFQIFQDDAGLNSATQYAVEDANYNVNLETNFRIRFQVANTGDGAENITRRLEFKEDAGAWTQITTNSNNVRLVDSSNFSDGSATTAQLTATGTFTAGQGKDTGSDTSQISLAASYYTEDEYALKFESSADNHYYQFRITNSGIELDTYSQMPTITFRGAGLRIKDSSLRINNGSLRIGTK